MKSCCVNIATALTIPVAAANVDWDALNHQAYEESLIPVALPARDGIPFWNVNAKRFIHPPAFEISPVAGVEKYRFELTADDGKLLASFESADPQEALTGVWKDLPVQLMNLNVYPLNADGTSTFSSRESRYTLHCVSLSSLT